MKKILFLLAVVSTVFVASSCTKEEVTPVTSSALVLQSETPDIDLDALFTESDAIANRCRPCWGASGMEVTTYGQNMVVPTMYSIIIGGSVLNPPLNAVIDMEYRVSTDLRNWSQSTLVYARTVTAADTGATSMVGFSYQIVYLQPGEWVVYRPVIYVGGCDRPIFGVPQLVHTLRQ